MFCAWREFVVGKKSKQDVKHFHYRLIDSVVSLYDDLSNGTYQHGGYEDFYITDPKRRHIHKAGVRDRLMHHAVYRILYPLFDKRFIFDSYSCRLRKGTHRAINRFRAFAYKTSQNNTRTCWVLKCDIRKFFASVDHIILSSILRESIVETNTNLLLDNIIGSFESASGRAIGLPLGNLTSQLFANIYLDKLDQWMKHEVKAKYYIRYADDFVIFSQDRDWLIGLIPQIQDFLQNRLKLSLHPDKVIVRTIASGVDFIGWIHFPDYRILRKSTRRRMLNRVRHNPFDETLQSYLGLVQHGNAEKIKSQLLSLYWLWQ